MEMLFQRLTAMMIVTTILQPIMMMLRTAIMRMPPATSQEWTGTTAPPKTKTKKKSIMLKLCKVILILYLSCLPLFFRCIFWNLCCLKIHLTFVVFDDPFFVHQHNWWFLQEKKRFSNVICLEFNTVVIFAFAATVVVAGDC